MWSIAPLGNEIRYRVISRLLSRRPAPAASQPRPHAVETDKPPKTHRCSGRSGFTSSGVIPQRWPTSGSHHLVVGGANRAEPVPTATTFSERGRARQYAATLPPHTLRSTKRAIDPTTIRIPVTTRAYRAAGGLSCVVIPNRKRATVRMTVTTV